MASSQDLTAIHDGSIVFDRFVGSLGAAISPDDYFGTKAQGYHHDDVWEESEETHRVSSIELTGRRR